VTHAVSAKSSWLSSELSDLSTQSHSASAKAFDKSAQKHSANAKTLELEAAAHADCAEAYYKKCKEMTRRQVQSIKDLE
jgi:hypothetical protein